MGRGWGYHVSDVARRGQVDDNTRYLAELDALDALGDIDWPEWVVDSIDLAVASRRNLDALTAALGWTREDVVALLAYTSTSDALVESLGITDEPPRDAYTRGKRAAERLDALIGSRPPAPVERAKLRATFRRRLRTAQRALRGAA